MASDLFDESGELKSRQKILIEFQLTQKSYFKWVQLIHEIPRSWKLAVLNDKGNSKNIIYFSHHLIKNSQILAIENLIPKNHTLYLLFWKMNFLRPKNVFATFFPIYQLNGKRFISYHTKFQITSIYVCSNIKYWTNIFYFYFYF